MKKITVFTPTFNRAYILYQLYESLLRQTSKDFIWLIIDDGSTDNTKNLVHSWIDIGIIDIQYHYKENGGMHTAHNTAYKLINTELNMCIDSDDYLTDDAIEYILKTWDKTENKDIVSGLVGLDADVNGEIVGSIIPKHLSKGSYYDLYQKAKVTGDKKFVLNTKLVKRYDRYPEYIGEKLVPLGILYIMMGYDNPFIYTNKTLCIVDYQDDGSSKTVFKQYATSPKGFAYARNIGKKFNKSFVDNLKNSIHIVSSAIFAKDISLIYKGVKVYLNFMMIPFGIVLNIYVKMKNYERNL